MFRFVQHYEFCRTVCLSTEANAADMLCMAQDGSACVNSQTRLVEVCNCYKGSWKFGCVYSIQCRIRDKNGLGEYTVLHVDQL